MADTENKIACPACEYERNSHGHPVERDGQMQCLDCGSSWREFGTHIDDSAKEPVPTLKKTRVRELSEKVSFQTNDPDEYSFHKSAHIKTHLTNYKPGLGTLMACLGASLLFVGLYLGLFFLQTDSQVMPSDKPIPSIAIILRKQNGSEITRWHYNSSLAALRAGGKSRFASSIQYDTPIVAYAEAVFK